MDYTETLKVLINRSVEHFQLMSKETWLKKQHPDKWSKQELLGHLIDSALTNLRRFVVTQYEQEQKIVYAQDNWVKLQNYQQAYHQELIELWRLLNLQIIRTINNIPPEKLLNLCNTGELRTLDYLIADYITHLNHHLEQIKAND